MARPTLDDVGQLWGEDVRVSPTGDLARVNGEQRSKERVLRRLMTNPGDYETHVGYGAGLPRDVGALVQKPKMYAKIKGQMLLEASVSQKPPPATTVDAIQNGISAKIKYTVLPDGLPVTLDFSLED